MSVKLTSSDGLSYTLPADCAILSELIRTTLTMEDSDEIILPSISGGMLELVVEYLQQHRGLQPCAIVKPLQSSRMQDICDVWDATFIDRLEKQDLYNMVHAANYMHIDCLFQLCCAKIASMLKGVPLNDLDKTLAIQ